MLDINYIRDNTDKVKQAVVDKAMEVDIDFLLEVDTKRRALIEKVEALRADRNEVAKNRDIEKGRQIKADLDQIEPELRLIQEQFDSLMLYVPNIPAEDSPIGPNSDANQIIKTWGNKPEFDFEVKDHIQLANNLDIIDLEQGAKVSGFRGYYLKGAGAILHWAVVQYAFKKMIDAGYTPMVPPTLVHEDILEGSGHYPFGKDNIYQIANPGKIETGDDITNPVLLTGTSEPALLAYYKDKVINQGELPIKVCALTHCYRSEVGDYGRDTRGLYRIHEFDKVEQVVICAADLDESEKYWQAMQQLSEEILQELAIPYQVVATSTGDMGAGKYHMNDIEAWMPGRGKYGETHSNSNLLDWQARRMNIKYKNSDGKNVYAYTLNNTVIASPRVLIAILENGQQADGSIKIPAALVPFTGFDKISR